MLSRVQRRRRHGDLARRRSCGRARSTQHVAARARSRRSVHVDDQVRAYIRDLCAPRAARRASCSAPARARACTCSSRRAGRRCARRPAVRDARRRARHAATRCLSPPRALARGRARRSARFRGHGSHREPPSKCRDERAAQPPTRSAFPSTLPGRGRARAARCCRCSCSAWRRRVCRAGSHALLSLLALLEARGSRRARPAPERELPTRLCSASRTPVAAALHNRGARAARHAARRRPPGFVAVDAGRAVRSAEPHARQRAVATTSCPSARGRFAFGDVHLRLEGLLGARHAVVTLPRRRRARVYPNLRGPRRYELAPRGWARCTASACAGAPRRRWRRVRAAARVRAGRFVPRPRLEGDRQARSGRSRACTARSRARPW